MCLYQIVVVYMYNKMGNILNLIPFIVLLLYQIKLQEKTLYTSSAVFFVKKPVLVSFLLRFRFVLVSFRFLAFSVFTNAFLTNAFFFHKRVLHFSPFSNSANRI